MTVLAPRIMKDTAALAVLQHVLAAMLCILQGIADVNRQARFAINSRPLQYGRDMMQRASEMTASAPVCGVWGRHAGHAVPMHSSRTAHTCQVRLPSFIW